MALGCTDSCQSTPWTSSHAATLTRARPLGTTAPPGPGAGGPARSCCRGPARQGRSRARRPRCSGRSRCGCAGVPRSSRVWRAPEREGGNQRRPGECSLEHPPPEASAGNLGPPKHDRQVDVEIKLPPVAKVQVPDAPLPNRLPANVPGEAAMTGRSCRHMGDPDGTPAFNLTLVAILKVSQSMEPISNSAFQINA